MREFYQVEMMSRHNAGSLTSGKMNREDAEALYRELCRKFLPIDWAVNLFQCCAYNLPKSVEDAEGSQ